MNSEVQTKILARIRKMMALANDAGATEGERDNALRMAHATLAKYNLDMASVDAGTADKEEPREMLGESFYARPWARSTCQSIAHLYFCHYFYSGRGRLARHVFIGRHSNVISALEMSKFVVTSVYQEASKFGRSIGEGGEGAAARNFGLGASHRIYARCQEIRKAAETQQPAAPAPATGTAIVLASLYATEQKANVTFLESAGIKLGNGRRSKSAGEMGYDAGRSFGNRVSLNTQVGGSRQRLIK